MILPNSGVAKKNWWLFVKIYEKLSSGGLEVVYMQCKISVLFKKSVTY